MRPAGILLSLLLLASAAACRRDASAQTSADPYGPVRCFVIADAEQLSEDSAISLCTGAISDAPGRCYEYGIDNAHELSSQKLVTLCTGATSIEPMSCYERLHATGTLTEDQVVTYCQTRCGIGPPPPQASDPECLEVALRRTTLALKTAGELCLGSSSAGPVYCFLAGLDLHKVSDSKLVGLCREIRSCQYVNETSY